MKKTYRTRRPRRSIVRRLHFWLLLPGLLFAASPALAHARLERASPAVGSTIKSAPAEITLRFTEKLEPAFSTVAVTGRDGERVDTGDPHVDPGDPMVLRVSLKPLAAGPYKVAWRVVSVDTHVTQGDFKFTIAP
jgi:methionine-rich copper-binding protein CopC